MLIQTLGSIIIVITEVIVSLLFYFIWDSPIGNVKEASVSISVASIVVPPYILRTFLHPSNNVL